MFCTVYVDAAQEKSMIIVTLTSGLTTLTASMLNITFSEKKKQKQKSN